MVDDVIAKRQSPDKNRGEPVRKERSAPLNKRSITSKKRVTGKSYGLSETDRLIFAMVYRLRTTASDIKSNLTTGILNQDKCDDLAKEFRELFKVWCGEGGESPTFFRPDPHRFVHDLNNCVSAIQGYYDLYTEASEEDDLKQISNWLDRFVGLLDKCYAYLLDNAETELYSSS
jgi:hypothetical protein